MLRRCIALSIVASGIFVAASEVMPVRTRLLASTRNVIAEHSSRRPLTFEQSGDAKAFFARTLNYELSINRTEAVLAPYLSKKNAQDGPTASKCPHAVCRREPKRKDSSAGCF